MSDQSMNGSRTDPRIRNTEYNIKLLISVSDPDPYHWPGSASGNVDLDPGTKKNRDKLAYKSTKIIKI